MEKDISWEDGNHIWWSQIPNTSKLQSQRTKWTKTSENMNGIYERVFSTL